MSRPKNSFWIKSHKIGHTHYEISFTINKPPHPGSDQWKMKNAGTQWKMVSYLKKEIKLKVKEREKDPGGRLGSTS